MNYGFDIDNTIYHAKDEKSTFEIKKTLEIILAEGHFITFITRRERYNLDPIKDLLKKYENTNVICANGSYDLSGKLEEKYLENVEILNTYLQEKKYHFLIITKNGYIMHENGTLEGLRDFYQCSTSELKNVTSIMIASKKNKKLEAFFDNNNFNYSFSEQYNNYVIDNSKVSKQTAVKQLDLKLDIAAGDSLQDDYEFVKAAKYSFWLKEDELSGIINVEKEQLAKVLLSIR